MKKFSPCSGEVSIVVDDREKETQKKYYRTVISGAIEDSPTRNTQYSVRRSQHLFLARPGCAFQFRSAPIPVFPSTATAVGASRFTARASRAITCAHRKGPSGGGRSNNMHNGSGDRVIVVGPFQSNVCLYAFLSLSRYTFKSPHVFFSSLISFRGRRGRTICM